MQRRGNPAVPPFDLLCRHAAQHFLHRCRRDAVGPVYALGVRAARVRSAVLTATPTVPRTVLTRNRRKGDGPLLRSAAARNRHGAKGRGGGEHGHARFIVTSHTSVNGPCPPHPIGVLAPRTTGGPGRPARAASSASSASRLCALTTASQ
ncbi:hypothetical protein GCM10010472_51060 [Pseudonocardia halophobica]|uniref:Uncharacterized protein n=1 Tax=Pseudonocardia halophobica TaxID=29401 RepID=A0A9W6L0Y8_9PSEU|nr:hypothetical protein GCM10017577_23840 [Pseudonocardia halophobica]